MNNNLTESQSEETSEGSEESDHSEEEMVE
jgi:hypothetical protein